MSYEIVKDIAKEIIHKVRTFGKGYVPILEVPGMLELCVDKATLVTKNLLEKSNNEKSENTQFYNCFAGELAEQTTNFLSNEIFLNRNKPLIANDEEVTKQYWHDYKAGDMFIEVKSTTNMLRKWFVFETFNQLETIRTNCNKLDLIIYYKIDEDFNVYPQMIIYGKTFAKYLKISRYVKDAKNPECRDIYYDHITAAKDGQCWLF